MPKALFFNIPGHGHINPSLPVVAELVHRGHEVIYFATEGFRASIESTGATFCAYKTVQDDYFEAQNLSGSVPKKVAVALLTTTGEILPELLEQAKQEQPDYIIYDGMCPWGYFVGQILKLPTVVSYALMPLTSVRAIMHPLKLKVVAPVIVGDMSAGIKSSRKSQALGKQYGVKALGTAEFLNAPADLGISYASAYFVPYAQKAPAYLHFVGRVLDDTPQDPSFSFEAVKGRKLIYVSLGTLNNQDPSLFHDCVGAFRDSQYYVLISTGKGTDPASFGGLPENIAVYSWVPQLDVLRRADMFITHGGLGSILDGLYFGLPLLMVPQQGEQMLNSMRAAELKAGVVLNKNIVSVDSLRWYSNRLLNEPEFKTQAQKIGDSFRAAGGALKAADLIEDLLKNSKAP